MGEKSYSNVTLSALIHKYDYIFPPTFLRISISDNGTDFTEAAYAGFDLQGRMHDGNGCKEYTLDFPETSARYLKVQAGCLKALPDWHPGAGRPGFVFVDEIVVR
jgi:hexosaminidase